MTEDGVFVTASYDTASHFEDASTEVLALLRPRQSGIDSDRLKDAARPIETEGCCSILQTMN